MSDETAVQNVQEQSNSQVTETESAVETKEISVDNDFREQLFKVMDNQNKIIEEIKKQNAESQKAIVELKDKITDVKSTMTENVPTVLGKFNFDETISDLTKEQQESLYKENREIYDIIKTIWKS